ncbi:hypothetical protein SteCoe_15777 [Stentor coeruleus]|uniref:SET domain-containing protein n=1 Tax=Stentor coeruleus TaxID=5963 RepID=A0A1R2C2U2_9CILI|nr:hypothetical protein SteCoe_15777 [Stentor coeruleus]
MVLIIFYLISLAQASKEQDIESALEILNSFCQGCSIQYLGEAKGYGVIAEKDFKFGEITMVIPYKDIITSFDHYPWSTYFESFNHENRLIPRLIYEKFKNPEKTNIKTLVNFLPESFSNYITMSSDEKQYFSQAFPKFKIYFPVSCIEGFNNYLSIIKNIPNISDCPECLLNTTYTWACQNVLTRAYGFKKLSWTSIHTPNKKITDPDTLGSAIIFGSDMFNHMPDPKIKIKSLITSGVQVKTSPLPQVIVRTDRYTNKGDEIFHSYGNKKNLELINSHGFIIENSPDDYYSLLAPRGDKECRLVYENNKMCAFYLEKNTLNKELLIFVGGREGVKDFDDFFMIDGGNDVEKVRNEVVGYREIVLKYDFDRCEIGLREIRRKLRNDEYSSRMIRNIDQVCAISHKLFYTHLKHLEKALVKVYYYKLFG